MERMGERIIATARREERQALSEREARQLLALYGIPSVAERSAKDEAECEAAVAVLRPPYVVKIDSPAILHKTEVGGVVVGCRDLADVLVARTQILAKADTHDVAGEATGVLIQEMVQGAVECFIGIKQDPQFGPVIAFGLGGIWVELFADAALRIPPVSQTMARGMIKETRAALALAGLRGRPPCDLDAVVAAIYAVGRLALEWQGEIAEMDINPLMALPDGILVVDALVVLSGGAEQ